MTAEQSLPCLTQSDLSRDQQAAITRLYEFDHTFLVAKMGAGKTVICLSAIAELLSSGDLNRVLVIAPKTVCEDAWRTEYLKWSHTTHLRVAVAVGNPKQRIEAVESDAQIVVINFENVRWFLDKYAVHHGFDGLVIDELSKLKDPGGSLFRKLRRRVKDFVWRVGMTGTPVSEDFVGLYGQMMMVDNGISLGTDKQRYLDEYFFPTDYERRNWALRPGAEAAIVDLIREYVYTVEDYRHELPSIAYFDEVVALPPEARALYDTLRKDMLVAFEDGSEIIAQNSAVLTGKLAQAANGFLYDREIGETVAIHNAKIDALCKLVDEINAPVLIAYWFDEDRQRIERALDCPTRLADGIVDDWNAGRLPALAIHPRSAGHGLNLARGGCNVIWYGPYWSRDLWEQLNARLWRKGQTKAVTVYTLVAEGTIDDVIIERVDGKGEYDQLFMRHLQG